MSLLMDSGRIPVSACSESIGVVLNAPVILLRASFWTGSSFCRFVFEAEDDASDPYSIIDLVRAVYILLRLSLSAP